MTYKTHILYQKGDFKKVALLDGRTVRTKYGVLYPCRVFYWRLLSASRKSPFFQLVCLNSATLRGLGRCVNGVATVRRRRLAVLVWSLPLQSSLLCLRTKAAEFIIANRRISGSRLTLAASHTSRRRCAPLLKLIIINRRSRVKMNICFVETKQMPLTANFF